MSLPVLCEEVTCLDVCDVVGSFSLYLLWRECLSVVVLVCAIYVMLCGKGCRCFLVGFCCRIRTPRHTHRARGFDVVRIGRVHY